jgi:hypothetical protein
MKLKLGLGKSLELGRERVPSKNRQRMLKFGKKLCLQLFLSNFIVPLLRINIIRRGGFFLLHLETADPPVRISVLSFVTGIVL